ncbi:hypothetical protein [Umezawaea sp. Da 62-37]|uniref:hypothetical protein n=1 Tax=Umezawaea sp. Da 62-37 TaxID=3075927 RepID=UPI0028F6CB71|nr:hypothetical protein [Umezawaea sp. Da 62-37]WNV91728.1 hypothetical protein RM788_26805 [Umezawaea sp. Da 62-37]
MRSSLAALVTAAVLLAGCTSGGGTTAVQSTRPTASTAPSADPAIAYMDRVCAATSEFAGAAKSPPALDTTDPAKLKSDMAAHMGQLAGAFGKSAADLRAIGPAPVAGGDEQVAKMATTFDEVAQVFTDAKAKVEAADAADPNGGLQAASEAIGKLAEFSVPLKDLETSPELLAAAEKAPRCQSIREPATPTTTS